MSAAEDRKMFAIVDRLAPKPVPMSPGTLLAEVIYSAGCSSEMTHRMRSQLEAIAVDFVERYESEVVK